MWENLAATISLTVCPFAFRVSLSFSLPSNRGAKSSPEANVHPQPHNLCDSLFSWLTIFKTEPCCWVFYFLCSETCTHLFSLCFICLRNLQKKEQRRTNFLVLLVIKVKLSLSLSLRSTSNPLFLFFFLHIELNIWLFLYNKEAI